MLIYSWAVPRKGSAEKGSDARPPFPDWFPESWAPLKSLIRRLRLSVSIDEVAAGDCLEEGQKAASDYQNAEKVVTDFVKRVCARPSPNKEERTERTSERTLSPPTPSLANAKEGNSEPKLFAKKQNIESFDALLSAAREGRMDYTEKQLPKCRTLFWCLESDGQKAAIQGIKLRIESGDYGDPEFTPRLVRYLREKLWEGIVRRDPKRRSAETVDKEKLRAIAATRGYR
jgi:hypothetical protein